LQFEWDENKNISNQQKHGVSFEEASQIWNDPFLLIVPARNKGETRKLAIRETYSIVISIIHTKRGDKIRIISARKASDFERKKYFENRR
jgi:hypothetical protein